MEEELKFIKFHIVEDGEFRDITLKEIEEFEKEGYIVEVRLVRPEKVIELSIELRNENKEKE